MSKWLDDIQDNARQLQTESYDLSGLARSFERTGNFTVAEELEAYAQTMRISSSEILKAVGQHLSEEVDRGQKSIASTLTTLLNHATREMKS